MFLTKRQRVLRTRPLKRKIKLAQVRFEYQLLDSVVCHLPFIPPPRRGSLARISNVLTPEVLEQFI